MSTKPKRAFITGVFGQDGSYLAEHLLALEYEVCGLALESDLNTPLAKRLSAAKHFSLCIADLCDTEAICTVLREFKPDELYSIAAVSDLKTARERPEYTYAVNYTAIEKLFTEVLAFSPETRMFHALSSRILEANKDGVISESSPLAVPKNAYDEAKRDSYEKVIMPLRKKGHFVVGGFLCNHESPRRGNRFVTGKIAEEVVKIKRGVQQTLFVGNVDAKRDWSFAGDVVRAMHAMLTCDIPHDFVIGSGELHTVREFIDVAFMHAGMPLTWNASGIDTKAYDAEGVLRVAIDPTFYQVDDNPVVSDIIKIINETSWKPQVDFKKLVEMMVDAELAKATLST